MEIELIGENAVDMLVPIIGMLTPVFIIWVIYYYTTKSDKEKYGAMVSIAKNLQNPSDVKELLESFKEEVKKPVDYRKSGFITMFVGLGLLIFGSMISVDFLMGAGLFVMCIGLGSLVAGYVYPNEGGEIDDAVQKYEDG